MALIRFAPNFKDTCVGQFLELTKYLNHAEFMSDEHADAGSMTLAKHISRIAFEHNLIFIWKGENVVVSNLLTRG